MAKLFKPSSYNFIIPENDSGDVFLFNGLHSSMVRLSPNLHMLTEDILTRKSIDASTIPPEARLFFNMLIKGKFIVVNPDDEVDIIKKRFYHSKEDGLLHLIVAPTLDCNLKCIYCYQSRSPAKMSIGICDELVNFTHQKLHKGKITDIHVDWYGGEPLLALQTISYLSKNLRNLSRRFGCDYTAAIATNGTLLDDNAVSTLISNKVKSCQITIDGPKEIHDKRRGYRYANGSSFDQILINMRRIVRKMELSVRVNIDEDNIKYAESLLDIFKEEGFFSADNPGFYPYLALAGPINPCMPFQCKPSDINNFYKSNLKFQKKVFELSGKKQLRPIFDFPFPVNGACGALRKNTYAFDPNGYYLKCGLEIGEVGKECGSIHGEINELQSRRWEEYSPFQDPECLKCRYLPFCMGNCPKVEFDKNSFYGKDGCVYWKGNMENIIRLYVKAMEEAGSDNCVISKYQRRREHVL